MSVVLHPRFADRPGKLRVWIGVTGGNAARALSWQLDGAPAQPAPLRRIASARNATMLHGNPQRTFVGLYEFDAGGPGVHRVSVRAGTLSASTDVRTFSDTLPASLDQWFNVLLVSCYYQGEARPGALSATLDRVRQKAPPHMSVLMGDQVYLDLPTVKDFDDDLAFLAAKFEADYVKNWMTSPGFSEVLRMAPSVSIPDDHEYSVARPYEVDISPVSFLFADGRSDRQSDRSRAFHWPRSTASASGSTS